MRKFPHKSVDVVLIFFVVILNRLFQSLVQLQWQVVFFVYSIQNCNSLLQLGISLIVVRHDGRQ